MRLLGKLICLVTRKHRRGRRLTLVTVTTATPLNWFECPRCGTQWFRKVRSDSKPRKVADVTINAQNVLPNSTTAGVT
jgi:hypothetical protein